MFEYGTSADVSLINSLNTGKTKHERVKNAFENIFSSPDAFMQQFEEKNKPKAKSKVVALRATEENIADDYDF